MIITILRFFLMSLVTIGLSACFANPSHSPGMSGEVIITKNDNQALCFAPKLDKIEDNEKYVELPYIEVTDIVIRRPASMLDTEDYVQSFIEPKKNYYRMTQDSQICLDNIPEELNYEIKESFDSNKPYALGIGGMDMEKRRRIVLYTEFNYPIE